ncbi:MAG TPA: DNA/RNA helicase domain-containing protein, partial [Tepidiformaceae bacterium]|nr:DNA/RNA helicase domain-containing protein [Tepidiformaceae bacterium]
MTNPTDRLDEARRGWDSDFVRFSSTPANAIVDKLRAFLAGASAEQVRTWDNSIPQLQAEVEQVREVREEAASYTAILEYELPLESRRADAIFLLRQSIVVIELKGKAQPSDADIDQAHAYARDLRCYHVECERREVHALLVPTHARGDSGYRRGVRICGPDALDQVVGEYDVRGEGEIIDPRRFLSGDAYRPLPTLVAAARELFTKGTLRRIKRAAAATDDAVEALSAIVHEAARTRSRHLILLTGVPGAGKTLVGLRLVHSHFIDDLAVPRAGGKPTSPAVFLSGNGPLVEVLQYELRDAGGGGRTFVRDVKNYVKHHNTVARRIPSEHVLVYDEAQRAYDAAMVATKHPDMAQSARSEPELFVEFAERIPQWCVVVALVGGGQEIHTGEEGGTVQWANAVAASPCAAQWVVHGPPTMVETFNRVNYRSDPLLNLDQSLRSHLSFRVHEFVAGLVAFDPVSIEAQAQLAEILEGEGHDLRITRDLGTAKRYLRERYAQNPDARFGLVASSRDRDLERFDIPNDYQSTKRMRNGPWYGDDESAEGGRSCRHLRDCVTEFGAQGLELDAVLLAWGTDFRRKGNRWNTDRARGYKRGGPPVRNPWQLRANAYRVLLTRA